MAYSTRIAQNQMEKKTKHEMANGLIKGAYRNWECRGRSTQNRLLRWVILLSLQDYM